MTRAPEDASRALPQLAGKDVHVVPLDGSPEFVWTAPKGDVGFAGASAASWLSAPLAF